MTGEKKEIIFKCDACQYETFKKDKYERHLVSAKHNRNIKGFICDCGKRYKHKSSLSFHKKKCNVIIDNEEDKEELIKTLVKQNTILLNELKENKLAMITNNVTNNITNNVNLNIFLNEECRDALNLTDFIKSLNIEVQDLDYSKDNGLNSGIANIFVNGLKELGMYKRPIHCTDIKRETLYIKEDNEWCKDEAQDKLKTSFDNIADKQRKAISEWEKNNPSWDKTEKGKEDWTKMIKNVMDKVDNKNQDNDIVKFIAKEVKI